MNLKLFFLYTACGNGHGPHLVFWVGFCLPLLAVTTTQAAFLFFSNSIAPALAPRLKTNRALRKLQMVRLSPEYSPPLEAQGLNLLMSSVPSEVIEFMGFYGVKGPPCPAHQDGLLWARPGVLTPQCLPRDSYPASPFLRREL